MQIMVLMNGALRVRRMLRGGPGDCSRIAQVRAILDAAKLSTRIICDNRVISCMNAVKSVESVLKKVPPDVGIDFIAIPSIWQCFGCVVCRVQ